MPPVLEQVLHAAPDVQAWRPSHDCIVEGLVAIVLQLQHQIKAVHHVIGCVKALHIHVHVQPPVCIQQERPDGIPCRRNPHASFPCTGFLVPPCQSHITYRKDC